MSEQESPPPDERPPGIEQVAAAAAARGLHPQQVRTDPLMDGDEQYVAVEPAPDPTSARRLVLLCLAGATVFAIVAVVAGFSSGTILQGVSLGAALFLVAVALVLAATRLLPEEVVVQERHEADGRTSQAQTVEVAGVFGRRSIIGAAVAALGAIGAALAVPARGIGTGAGNAGQELRTTAWGPGVRAVDLEGEPVRADQVPRNGMVTVWPEGDPGAADAQTVLLRVDPVVLTPATMALGTPDGLVAYSKVCTHAGCAIGQFRVDDHEPETHYELVCPCHQSQFDVTQQAAPAGGPATRPLAQLPVTVDDDGYVVATEDFTEPPGPAWSSR